MPTHTFRLNGRRISVQAENSERLLWVLRDRLGVKGPKYGCGINVCKACTCHINGEAFNPCSVPVSRIKPSDEITTIEGLAKTVKQDLHPMQRAWLELDVAQCGYCQPGQIMSAVSRVNETRRQTGRMRITDRDIEQIRNVCRCGTYPRIREAIRLAAKDMPMPARRRRKRKTKAQRRRERRRAQRRRETAAERRKRRNAARRSRSAVDPATAPPEAAAPPAATATPAPAAPQAPAAPAPAVPTAPPAIDVIPPVVG